MTTTVIGVNLKDRAENSQRFQEILTKYGCSIRTRIGIHHSENGACTNKGIVLLDVDGEEQQLVEELSGLCEIQTMTFD